MKIVRNNIEIGKWYHGLTMIPQAYCNDKLVFPNIYSDVEEGYDVMCSGTINDYEGTAPEVYVMSVSKWYMRTTGGNYKEYGVYGADKNDPYVGELVVVDGHEWEYTSSGWVDLGETSGSISRLPQGYTELEYIQSYDENNIPTFPAIIQTDYYPNYQSKFEFKMQALVNNDFPRLWGSGAWNGYYGLQMDFESYVTGPIRIHALGSSGWSISNTSGDYNANDYIYDRGKLYKNGALILSTTNASVTASDPMAIFTFYNSAYTQGAGYHVKPGAYLFGRLYYFSIYDNDVLVKQYVPAKRNSDNMVGVYDLVNSEFITAFTDANHSTQFVAGPAITELTLPNVSYSLNYNAKNMDGSKLLKTDGQLVNTDATINGSFTSSEDHITIPSGTNIPISGYQTYMNRTDSNPQLTIVSKAVTTLSGAHSLIANRGGNYNWMYRQYQNKLTLHGNSEQGSITLTVDNNPKILSIRVDPERLLRYNNWTEGSVGTTTYSSFSYGGTESTGFSMFSGYYNQNNENWGGDFYWLYVTQKYLSNEQIRQIIAYNEGSSNIQLPKEYTEMDAPDPIDYGYYTSPDEYLKNNDNYYKKDYVIEIYEGGCEVITTEYVQGEQLTPSYVQGQESDFIVYDGGRYYKNYIYVTPVSTPIATGDYVRGEYIGPADVLVSGLTNSSTAFNVNIDGTATPVTIGSSSGSNYEWRVYGDLSKSVSVRQFAVNKTNLVTCHFLVSGITDTYSCFSNCYNLKEVSFVSGVTSFGKWTFSSCRSLTSVNIPSSVTSIGQEAFVDCSGVTSIIIPDSVTTIGISAFKNCRNLTSLNIPSSVTSIGNDGPNGWELVTGCSKLTSLTVDANNPVYDSRDNCNAIIHTATNVLWMGCNTTVIPNTVTKIAQGAFKNNGVIETMTIPNSVTSLGQYAFFNCGNLKTITIPSSVTSIDSSCFRNDNTVFHFEATTPPTLNNSDVFLYGNGIIYVPVGTAETYKAATNWSRYADRIYEEGTDFSTKPVTGTASGGTVKMSFGNSTWYNGTYYDAGKFFIDAPATATTVGYYSDHKSSTNITSIDLSRMANLTTIHESAFNGYGNPNMLTSVILPDTVTTIMAAAFSNQNNLTSINMPSSLVTIGDSAFYDCNVPSITIPSTVTSIGRYAFNEAYNTVFHFESETPCTLSSGVFTYNSGGFIFVPVGTAATYKSATNWSNYASKIYEEGETPWVNAKITGKGGGYYMSRHSGGTMYVYHYVYDANGNSYANPPYNITHIGIGSTSGGVKGRLAHVDFRSCTTARNTDNYFVYGNANVKGIRLPSSISVYYSRFVMGDNVALDYITLDAVTPPEYLNYGSTTARISNFYVPDESVNAYKAATGWKELAGIIKPMSDFSTDFPNE